MENGDARARRKEKGKEKKRKKRGGKRIGGKASLVQRV